MYHPTTRLLTILELLQSHPNLSGDEMARRLEVDTRTVRRYITMLQDMGMPIEGSRGPGGGYQLRPGFKLPPLLFNEDEAAAIILGLLGTQWLQIDVDPVAVEGALAKIYRVLPIKSRARLQAIASNISVFAHGDDNRPDAALLVGLSDAIHERHRVALEYRSQRKEETHREVEPYGVVGWRGHWYMVGYCHLRQDVRTFRLDRIRSATILGSSFVPPENFDCLGYVVQHVGGAPNRWLVEVEFQAELEDVRDRIPGQYGELIQTPTGVLFRANHWDLAMMARYLVLVDLPFVIHQPPELRTALADLAERVQSLAGAA